MFHPWLILWVSTPGTEPPLPAWGSDGALKNLDTGTTLHPCDPRVNTHIDVENPFVSYFPQEATDFPMFLWFTRKSNAASQWIGHLFPMIFPMYINVYHISITQSGNSCFCRHIQTSSSSSSWWSCMYIYILYTVYPIKSNWILIVVGCISPFSWLKGFPPELPTIPRSPTLAVATSIFFSPTDGTTDSSRFWY